MMSDDMMRIGPFLWVSRLLISFKNVFIPSYVFVFVISISCVWMA